MNSLISQVLILFLSAQFLSPDPASKDYIQAINLSENQNKTIRGYLSEGRPIEVDWANNNSNVDCFPKKQNKAFNGHQLLYAIYMPALSILEISAISNKDISMYAFQVPTGDVHNVPPRVNKVMNCATSIHKENGLNDPESIFLTTGKVARKVIVGIAGANKEKKGAFELRMSLHK